jgi:thiamine-monophosphate kinase
MAQQISEINIIRLFQKHFKTQPHIFIGVVDPTGIYEDVGAIRIGGKKLLVVKTDLIGKKTHVPPGMSLYQMGRKAVVKNVSDLAAKGVEPLGLVFSTAFPKNITAEDIEEIAKGMSAAADEYNTCIIGGDTNMADDIILAGTAVGITTEDRIILRSGAKESDIVAVTGWLGEAALGIYCLIRHLEIDKALLRYALEPKAHLSEVLALTKLKAITSSGDITDGLAFELHKTAEASNVGVLIYEDQIPIREQMKEQAKSLKLNPLDLALHIGEDFELLLTITPKKWDIVQRKCAQMNLKITPIGKVIKEKKLLMQTHDGEVKPLEKKGYDQFLNNI